MEHARDRARNRLDGGLDSRESPPLVFSAISPRGKIYVGQGSEFIEVDKAQAQKVIEKMKELLRS